MMYFISWLIGGIMGVFATALCVAGDDSYAEGYKDGYRDGREIEKKMRSM